MVGEVLRERDEVERLAFIRSAASPVLGSVIASIEAYVVPAHRRKSCRSAAVNSLGFVDTLPKRIALPPAAFVSLMVATLPVLAPLSAWKEAVFEVSAVITRIEMATQQSTAKNKALPKTKNRRVFSLGTKPNILCKGGGVCDITTFLH